MSLYSFIRTLAECLPREDCYGNKERKARPSCPLGSSGSSERQVNKSARGAGRGQHAGSKATRGEGGRRELGGADSCPGSGCGCAARGSCAGKDKGHAWRRLEAGPGEQGPEGEGLVHVLWKDFHARTQDEV